MTEHLHGGACPGIDEGLAEATRLFRRIHTGWHDRPLTPRDAWREEHLDQTLGEAGVGIAEAVRDFERWILPGAVGAPDPRYMGLVNSSPLPAGPMADLLVSALDNNASTDHQAPSALAAEREVIRLFGRLFLGRDDADGMSLHGGSLATLQAILHARARAFPAWEREGPSAVDGRPALYVSDTTHLSGARAAHAAGIGREGVRRVPTTGRGAMDPDALTSMMRRDRATGWTPFAVIATAGTTGTGAIDPLEAVADIAGTENVWLHVDACYGGGAILVPELRPRLRGIARADSVAVDPHKWFFAPLTSSLLLLQPGRAGSAPFDIDAPYIADTDRTAPWRRGIATSRRAVGLALWMMLRAHGLGTIRHAVKANIRLARRLERRLSQSGFDVLPDGELSVVCARAEPAGMSSDELDELQARIAASVVDQDRAWISTVNHAGRTWLRMNILNLSTDDAIVDDVASAIAETADRMAADPSWRAARGASPPEGARGTR